MVLPKIGKAVLFDHSSNQEHASVAEFVGSWGTRPWDDKNIPVKLSLNQNDEGQTFADILVLQPRLDHVKHVYVTVLEGEEAELRELFKGVGELFGYAGHCLESYAHGWEGEDGAILSYWSGELPPMDMEVSDATAEAL